MVVGNVKTYRSLIDFAKGEAQVYPLAKKAKANKDSFEKGPDFVKVLKERVEKPAKVAENRPPRSLGNPLFREKA